METFNPQRLKIAMMRRGRSLWSVSEEIDIRLPILTKISRGKREPDATLVDAFAESLDFPREWFFGPDLEMPPPSAF